MESTAGRAHRPRERPGGGAAGQYARRRPRTSLPHYFRMMKELALLGYFSSEIGCTKAVRYIEVPGAYHGDVPYTKGRGPGI